MEIGNFIINVWQDWTDFFGKCNWYDFTLVNVSGEIAPYSGTIELVLGLVGFNLRVAYIYNVKSPVTTEIDRIIDEMEERENSGTTRTGVSDS